MLKDNILKGKCVSRFRNQFQKLEFHNRIMILSGSSDNILSIKCSSIRKELDLYIHRP